MEAQAIEGFRLSPQQRQLWLVGGNDGRYRSQCAISLEGDLDESALKRALHAVVGRHDVLRTAYRSRIGMKVPLQVIEDSGGIGWQRVDLGDLGPEERAAALDELFEELGHTEFDLEEPRLLLASLARFGPRSSVLVLGVPALCADACALGVLAADVAQAYECASAGRKLDEEVTQYLQFSEWQHEVLEEVGEAGASGREFWNKQQDSGFHPPALPFDLFDSETAAKKSSPAFATAKVDLAADIRAEEVLSEHFLLAGWVVLLGRLSGGSKLQISTSMEGRQFEELREMIGIVSRSLPINVDLGQQYSFRNLVKAIEGRIAEADRWQEYYFADVSSRPRVEFELERLLPSREAAGVVFCMLRQYCVSHPVHLKLRCVLATGTLQAELQYNADSFREEDVGRLSEQLATLLKSAWKDQEVTIDRLEILGQAERRQLLVEYNDTVSEWAEPDLVDQIFARQSGIVPDRIALIFEDRRLSFNELNRRAEKLALYLAAAGVRPETMVAIGLERSPEMIVALLGIMKAGAGFVPLDVTLPRRRLETILEDSRTEVLLTRRRLAAHLPTYEKAIVCLDHDWPAIARRRGGLNAAGRSPQNPAYVIFTSGSTGRPKGVTVEHRHLANYVRGILGRMGLNEACRFACVSTLGADLGNTSIFASLCGGGCLHILPEGSALDPNAMAEYFRRCPVDCLKIVPSHLKLLQSVDAWTHVLPRRILLLGGEASPPRWIGELLSSARCTISNHYGPSETTVGVMTWAIGLDESFDLQRPRFPIGRPLPNSRVYLLTSDLRPVPHWVPGEMFIAGAGVARGYLGRMALTARRFIPCPFGAEEGARMYRTGDLARYLTSGAVEFLGRVDHQVNLRGFRVELGEIEAVLESHPQVVQGAALVRDLEGDRRLVAHVVLRARSVGITDLLEFLKERIPAYMIPAIILEQRLPLLPNGKVDRKALAERESTGSSTAFVPAGTQAERVVTDVWGEVLKLENVGIEDNFFDLGGHSLLAVRVHAELVGKGYGLDIVDLFRYPSVKALAAFLEGSAPAERARPESDTRRRHSASGSEDIAIIGMAGRFPGAKNLDEFWHNLCGGVESIKFFSEEELILAGVSPDLVRNPSYVKAAGTLDDIDFFDARFFGYSPREAQLMDPQHRIFLECTWQALESAGYDPEKIPGRVGVYAGASGNAYLINIYSNPQVFSSSSELQIRVGNRNDFLTTRVSYKLGLDGPSVNVQTACSTSLVAVHFACESLKRGEADLALAGGVSVWPQKSGYVFQEGGILSPDGHCRAFDALAAGTLAGQGVGLVVLKPLRSALADGDSILTVVKGSAVNNDGAHKVGYTAPSVKGQVAVIREALAEAGVDPRSVALVEAHGTGTALGDPIEVAALNEAFANGPPEHRCALGSVKTNIGHLDAAAGIAGLIKAVLALKHGSIPPSLHYEVSNPGIRFSDGPFYVNTKLTDWPRGEQPRRAGVSAFGIGGTNAHVILEEAPALPAGEPALPWQVLVLSARSPTALEEMTANLCAFLDRNHVHLPDLAYTLQVGRRAFEHRRVVACRSREEAVEAFRSLNGERVFTGAAPPHQPPVVFMFPGQGSQYAGMGCDLYDSEPCFSEHVDRALELLDPALRERVRCAFCREKEEEPTRDLERTDVAQPALFILEYALARLWMEWGVVPGALVGHSLGELVAACLADVFSFEEGLELVVERGRLVQELPEGRMLSVALSSEEVRPYLTSTLSLAAVNGSELCVVSGPVPEVEVLEEKLLARSIHCRRLRTSRAFHSEMMEPALAAFSAKAREIEMGEPRIPFLSNLTGTWIKAQEAVSPEYWARHLREPVRFERNLRHLVNDPDRILLEVGPSRTLSTLARRHSDRDGAQQVLGSMPPAGERELTSACLATAVGRLWVGGVDVDWQKVHAGRRRRRIPAPTYPFERQRHWIPIAATHGVKANRSELREWFYVPAWRRSVPPAAEEARSCGTAAPWLVFRDPGSFGSILVERLRRWGADAVAVTAGGSFAREGDHAYALDPSDPGSYGALFEDLRRRGVRPKTICHLWNLTAGDESARSARAGRQLGSPSLELLARAMAEHLPSSSLRLGIVANHAHQVSGQERIDPIRSSAVGAARGFACGMPNLACKFVDVDFDGPSPADHALADRLIGELTLEETCSAVAYRGTHRWVEAFEPVPLRGEHGHERLREGGVYLVCGELGAAALEVAGDLGLGLRARLALVGRGPFPDRGVWSEWLRDHDESDPTSGLIRRVRAIEEHGSEVMLAMADAADGDALCAAILGVRRRFGDLHGVIHVMEPQAEHIAVPSTPSMTTGLALHRALGVVAREVRPGFLLLSSPLGSRFGGDGATASATLACLDALAQEQSAHAGPPTVTLSCDAWCHPALEAPTADSEPEWTRPERMTPRQRLEILRRALGAGVSQVIVSGEPMEDVAARGGRPAAVEAPGREEELRGELEARPSPERAHPHPRPRSSTDFIPPRDEAESRLARIWQDLLGLEEVGVHDDFFELGGDSVLMIQVLSRTRQAGLALAPRQVAEFRTIAELAAAAGSVPILGAEQGTVVGDVPLAPLQVRFFETPHPDPHYFNQSVLLRANEGLDPLILRRAVKLLLAHHDVLRARFRRQDGNWKKCLEPAAEPVPFAWTDLSHLAPERRATALEKAAAALQGSLGIEDGPLVRAVYFDLGTAAAPRLLMIAHHLLTDVVSWRILLEDLTRGYLRMRRNEVVDLPPKTTSYRFWAERLAEHSERVASSGELDFWLDQGRRASTCTLPVDRSGGLNTVGSSESFALEIDQDATRTLLQRVPRVFGVRINESLLAPLVRAFGGWTGRAALLIDLEGHGRAPIFEDVDLSRTVGWFTTVHPVFLDLEGRHESWGDDLAAVREQLSALPAQGFGYGLLRYLSRSRRAQELRRLAKPEVNFLYLGQLDSVLSDNDLLTLAREAAGPIQSPRTLRNHAIDITMSVTKEKLRMFWTFSQELHDRSTIESLAQSYKSSLERLIAEAGSTVPAYQPKKAQVEWLASGSATSIE